MNKLQESDNCIRYLREDYVKPGSTIHTILKHESRSGMSRVISAFVVLENRPVSISYQAAMALGWKFDRDKLGVRVGGCGMDMGFHLVYTLSRVLYPGGFECIGEGCPSNDHANGDHDYSGNKWHNDGGYALRHRWQD